MIQVTHYSQGPFVSLNCKCKLMPALTIMLLSPSFLPLLPTSIFGNFLAFAIKQVSRADLPGDKEGFVPLFLLDALSCSLAVILARQAIPVRCYSSSQRHSGTCSPQLQPYARVFLCQLREGNNLLCLQSGIAPDVSTHSNHNEQLFSVLL